MRAIVGREGLDRPAASTSEMGRFETEWLATGANIDVLSGLSGAWIDRVHRRRPPDGIILDIDSSESPTFGQQEGSAWNGHFRRTYYHPLSASASSATGTTGHASSNRRGTAVSRTSSSSGSRAPGSGRRPCRRRTSCS